MQKNKTILLRSFDILHSSFQLIAIICIMHVIFSLIPKLITIKFLSVINLGLKIFLLAGVYGTIIDMATEKIPAFSFKSFFENARSLWLIYLIIFFCKLCLVFLYISILKSFQLKPIYFVGHFDTVFLFFLSYFIIKKKKINLGQDSYEKTHISMSIIIIILFLHLLNEIFLNNEILFPINRDILSNQLIFIYTYIQLFTFIYLSNLLLENYSSLEYGDKEQKELYLINPVGQGVLLSNATRLYKIYPPIFVVLKALTPKYFEIKEFNRVTWKNRYVKPSKLVAITCLTSNSAEAYKIAKEFKKHGSTVIMGGPHVTFFPDEALKFCDSAVIGDADGVWEGIIHDYENGSLKKKYYGYQSEETRKKIHNELLNSDPNIIKYFLETTSGCKFKCYFCSIPVIKGAGIKKKPIEEVIELVSKIKRKYHFMLFLDNNIYSDPQYAMELFKALIPLKIKWSSQSSIDIGKNAEALKLAKKSGCDTLLIGYEISSDSKEAAQKGKFSYTNEYIKLTKNIKKAGIVIKGHFIFGFDSDNFLSALKLWKFCLRINPFATCLSILTPLPGSKFFYDMVKKNRIINYNWRNYGLQNLTFQPKSFRISTLKIFYSILKYFFLFTTCKLGYVISFLYLMDIIFFGFRHF